MLVIQIIAQPTTVQFKHLKTGDGLSQSSVIAIAQGLDGIMWFGTRDGLNKFDGNQFTVFRNIPEEESSISNNDILDLTVDQTGDLWVATQYGLNLFRTKEGKFQRFLHHPNDINSLIGNSVRSVIQRKNGQILAGTANGLSFIDKKSGNVQSKWDKGNKSQPYNIYVLYEDKSENIWVGTNDQIILLTENEKEPLSFYLGKRVQALIEDIHGNLLIGTNDGLFMINEEKRLISFDESIYYDKLNNRDIRALEFDDDGSLWIGTYNGINRIDKDNKNSIIQNIPSNPQSISRNTIKSIYKDQAGSIWVGAYYGGINIWDKVNSNFGRIKVNETGLNYDVISSMTESQDKLYIGTEGGGINIMDKQTGNFRYWMGNKSNNIKSIYLDTLKKEIWAGTFNDGVLILDDHLKISKVFDVASGLSHNDVYDIKPYLHNYMLISTFGGGLNIIDKENQHINVIKNDPEDIYSICDNEVRTSLVDMHNNIWIGTQDGLSFLESKQFRKGDFQMKNYFYDAAEDIGVDILTIYEDSKGLIWVGTKEIGLHFFDGVEFKEVPLFDKLLGASRAINAIQEDGSGRLWISSNNGVIRYDPATGNTRLFEESDGLVSNEFNNNASFKSSEGVMYFGGPNGILFFKPKDIIRSDFTLDVVLTDFKIYNQSILPRDYTGILKTAISQTDEIELDFDQANFTIQFALPSYVNSDKNRFAYRLLGLDNKWKNTAINQASFTIQEPGEYFFEVKGANWAGVWNNNPTVLRLKINPAPWKTWWAYLIYAISIFVALSFLIKTIRSKSELQANLEIEYRENEQQKLLNKMKLQFFTNISHEFRTSLTLIIGPLQQIIYEYRGSRKLFKELISIEKNADQLMKLINQLMEFRKLENKQASIQTAEGNIVKFTKEVFLSFQAYARTKKFQYEFFAESEEIKLYYDRDKMERVLYNIISNAFKYSDSKREIKVTLSQTDKDVRISIADSGKGIKPEFMPHIFERFYRIDLQEYGLKESDRGTGIGLAITKGIIDLHKGNIEVISEPGVGSTFVVCLPLGKNHLSDDQIIKEFKDSEELVSYQKQLQAIDNEGLTDVKEMLPEVKEGEIKKILVVEDNEEVRKFIIQLLESKYYEVSQAPNGKEGLKQARLVSPDLIISDVMMPVMNGIEFCTAIKSNIETSHIPVILLTARTSLIFKYEGLESGADDYINKPFNVKELQLKVKNILNMMDNLKGKFESNDVLSLSKVTITSLDEDLFKRAIEIVDRNIGNEFFDIPLFCSELGLSRTMLFTKIKAWTKMTPNEFIQSMRMKRAAQLLEQRKINVSQVSYQVGYKNPKYFSRTFQKHYAMTPTEYSNKFSSNDPKAE